MPLLPSTLANTRSSCATENSQPVTPQTRRGHHLAAPVYEVQSGVHGPAAFRLALPLDATRRGPRCPLGDPWRPELGAVCGALSPLADGALSPHLCVRPPPSGDRAHPLWAA